MTRIINKSFDPITWTWLVTALLVIALMPQSVTAASFGGQDLEKPRPEFSREKGRITAKLIPRAKSTSVLIHFEASGGVLTEVAGMDFEVAESPDVDHKDFKSALFAIKIQHVSPGGEARVSITSDFFTGSTEFWVFNPKLSSPWANAEAQNLDHPDLIQELVVAVKDGGPFDSDGLADGRITLVGGPKDSFWGYALGTLFIRFFGIFLVLGILMIGMILSGKIFELLEKKSAAAIKRIETRPPTTEAATRPAVGETRVGPELTAAVSVALHLHFSAQQSELGRYFFTPAITPWSRQGRERLMNARFLNSNRSFRLRNR